jgi:hypothetical protein
MHLFKRARLPNILAALLLTTLAVGLTRCASIAPGADKLLVDAERAQSIGFDTIDGFLKLESQNRAEFSKLVPGVTAVADQIRTKAPAAFHALDSAIDAYKTAKKSGVGIDAASAQVSADLAAIASFVASATDLSAKWSAAHSHSYLLPPIRPGRAADMPFFAVGAIALGTILPGILSVLAGLAGFIGGPGLGSLVGRVATVLLETGEKIAVDAHQSGELTDEQLAAWRKQRDDIIVNSEEWKPSTAPTAPGTSEDSGSGS